MKRQLTLTVIFLLLTAFYGSAQKRNDPGQNRADSIRQDILQTAYNQLGVPYKYAGRHPDSGFDCSGYVHYVFGQHGYELPVRSVDYMQIGSSVAKEQAIAGDIIIFAGSDKIKTPVGPVGIITENKNGRITFIHSASSADRGIVVSHLSLGYYKTRFAGIRRIEL